MIWLSSGLDMLDAAPRPEKPNVVLSLTDDLGWQDVGCYENHFLVSYPEMKEESNREEQYSARALSAR